MITNCITVDLAQKTVTPVVDAVQGDAGRLLKFTLSENGKAWTVPEGVKALVRYRNTQGGGGTYDTLPGGEAACSYAGNTLTAALAPAVCAVPGDTRVQVCLLSGAKQVSVFGVICRVEGEATGEASGDYVNLSQWLSENGQATLSQIQNYIDTRLGVIENGAY